MTPALRALEAITESPVAELAESPVAELAEAPDAEPAEAPDASLSPLASCHLPLATCLSPLASRLSPLTTELTNAPVPSLAFEVYPTGRFTAHEAARRVLKQLDADDSTCTLYHTRLGQPRFRRARGASVLPTEQPWPVVSFSDERDIRIATAARAPGLVGIGVDLLDVSRLARYAHDISARNRFERRVCRPDELQAQVAGPEVPLHVALAVRFSIKEAVSKALGTGLRLGLGLGAGHGLPMTSVAVFLDRRMAMVELHGPARGRMRRTGGLCVEARWVYHDPLVVALALLWR